MQKIKISVIVPVHNAEKYLRRCLNSIVSQTYKNLEIILINDGSADNSGLICDEYKKQDDRIIVIHKDNSGVSAARNTGLDVATGNYISFIDSDDWIDLNMYEILVSYIHKYSQIDLIIFGFIKKSYKESKIFHSKSYSSENIHIQSNNDLKLKFFDLTKKGLCYPCWNKLFSRECVIDKRFDINLIFGEDFDFCIDVFHDIEKTLVIDYTPYHYFQIINRLASYYSNLDWQDRISFYESMHAKLIYWGLPDNQADEYLANKLLVNTYSYILEICKHRNYRESLKGIKSILYSPMLERITINKVFLKEITWHAKIVTFFKRFKNVFLCYLAFKCIIMRSNIKLLIMDQIIKNKSLTKLMEDQVIRK